MPAATTRQLWIGGRPREAVTGQTFEDINPANGETIAAVALGGEQDI